jgi:hypothetical protein
MNKLVDQSRETLLKLLHSVDRVAEAYQHQPHLKGYPSLKEIVQEEITTYRHRLIEVSSCVTLACSIPGEQQRTLRLSRRFLTQSVTES